MVAALRLSGAVIAFFSLSYDGQATERGYTERKVYDTLLAAGTTFTYSDYFERVLWLSQFHRALHNLKHRFEIEIEKSPEPNGFSGYRLKGNSPSASEKAPSMRHDRSATACVRDRLEAATSIRWVAVCSRVGALGKILPENPELRAATLPAVRSALAAHDGPDGVRLSPSNPERGRRVPQEWANNPTASTLLNEEGAFDGYVVEAQLAHDTEKKAPAARRGSAAPAGKGD